MKIKKYKKNTLARANTSKPKGLNSIGRKTTRAIKTTLIIVFIFSLVISLAILWGIYYLVAPEYAMARVISQSKAETGLYL